MTDQQQPAVPTVPVQPVPVTWTINDATATLGDGTKQPYVVFEFHTFVGHSVFFIDPPQAMQMAQGAAERAQRLSSGLVTPPTGLVIPFVAPAAEPNGRRRR